MRIFKFLLFAGLTAFLVWALNRSWVLPMKGKELFLPAMGRLLSPNTGFWKNAEPKKGPRMLRSIRDKSLSAPVEVVYDDRMVPHIFGESDLDVFFAQGYVTASLRLWQMEFQTHAAAGRLTEILGTTKERRSILLEIDRKERLYGLPLAAKKAVEEWRKNPKELEMMQRYCDGINAYINSITYDQFPLEYKLMDYRPEPWTIEKTALLLKRMAKTLVSRDDDFELTNAYKYFGKDKFNQFYPEYFPEQSPIILDSVNYHFSPVPVLDSVVSPFLGFQKSLPAQEDKPEKGIGSNNWAVSGKKTASGHPILCNDPHLDLNLPSIWFEVQLVSPNFNAYGASLPGAPGIISGFNEHIAWGVTNVSHDVRDWYAISWKDASRKEYMVDGKPMPTIFVYDTIKIRGQKPIIDTFLYTHLGPIARSQDGKDYALRWLANDPSSEPLTFLGLMKGKNYQDYLNAIQHFACPAQNLVFACKDGDIALWTQGKLPLRRAQQGKFVMDGSKSENYWNGYIPQEQIPHEYNPVKGFVASANQHSVSPDYPYYTYGYFEEYRGRYLNAKLASMSNIGFEEMKALQNDAYSLRAQDFLPYMIKYLQRGNLTKDELELLAILENWNYSYDKHGVAPVIFTEWLYNFKNAVYDEIVFAQKEKNIEIMFPEEWHLFGLLKRDTANSVFDKIATTDKKETVNEVLTNTFKETYISLPRHDNKELYKWQDMKATALKHLAFIPEFGVENVSVSGDASALNAIKSRYDFTNSHLEKKPMYTRGSSSGPSWRMIVELSDEHIAYAIYPGGQSGNPGSYFYDNMIKDWAEGQYYRLNYLKSPEGLGDKTLVKQKFKN